MTSQQMQTVIDKVKQSQPLTSEEADTLKQMVMKAHRNIERTLRTISKTLVIPVLYEYGVEQRRRAGHKNAIVLYPKRQVKRYRRRAYVKALFKREFAQDPELSREIKHEIENDIFKSNRENGSRKKERGRRRKHRNLSLTSKKFMVF